MGLTLGLIKGDELEFCVGSFVGLFDGAFDGSFVGECVCVLDGVRVIRVGESEGFDDGLLVG